MAQAFFKGFQCSAAILILLQIQKSNTDEIFYFTFFSLINFCATAQQNIRSDSTSINARIISQSSLDAYRHKRDFQYDVYVSSQPSLWERFWIWVWEKYYEIVSTAAGRITMNIIYIVFAAAVIIFFMYKVRSMNRVKLFMQENKTALAYTVEEENIHAMSFSEAIAKALSGKDYRLAVRLMYLQNLKLLNDKLLITWQPYKTNYDYVSELNDGNLKNAFKKLHSYSSMHGTGKLI